MKLGLLSTLAFLLSVNAYAACPSGTTGDSDFKNASSKVREQLGQALRSGSHAEEITNDGKPLKIDFVRSGTELNMTLWRSVGGLYNTREMSGPAEVCSGNGQLAVVAGGYTLWISSGGGNGLKVSAMGKSFAFSGLSTGALLAKENGASR